jgi:hypothetical protein
MKYGNAVMKESKCYKLNEEALINAIAFITKNLSIYINKKCYLAFSLIHLSTFSSYVTYSHLLVLFLKKKKKK